MTYRKDGNLIKRVDGEEEKNYEYNNIGQLTKEDGIVYEYDTRGNRIKKVEGEEVTEYKYDYRDRLLTEKQGDKVTAYG